MTTITISAHEHQCLRPVIAYNQAHDEYLVVWLFAQSANQPPASCTQDIHARRVSRVGQLLGEPVVVASDLVVAPGRSAPGIAVVYNGVLDEYLVVWEQQLAHHNIDLRARRLRGNGTLAGTELSIASGLYQITHPVAAYNSADNQYLVVWEHYYADADLDVRARRLRADGVAIDTPVPVATNLHHACHPAVAYNSVADEFLIAWEHHTSTHNIDLRARRFRADIRPAGPELMLATGHRTQTRPAIAYNAADNEYLVVWEYYYADTDLDIRAQRLAADGSPIGPYIGVAASVRPESRPAAVYNHAASEYLVVWEHRPGTRNANILGRRLHSEGSVAGSVIAIATTDLGETQPAVAYDSDTQEYLVVWEEHDRADCDIVGRRVSARGVAQ